MTATATGRLTYLRVYAGTLRKGDSVRDPATGRTERVGRILRVQADRHEEREEAVAGDIVAVIGLKAAGAGTTLCAPGAPVLLEPPSVAEPVVSVAVEARRGTDTGRLAAALARLVEEDPSLVVRSDAETGQTVLSGMGELHLEVAVEKIRRGHGVEVAVGRPQVAYRETVVRGVTGFVYRHVKQDGGAGQFAHVVIDVEPWEEEGFTFRSAVVGGRVPQEYARAVEAGCRDALAEGPLGGHPVTGLRVVLTDGATHSKDSSEMAFRAAGRFALREALRASTLELLEPVAEVTVTLPEDTVGGVLGDLAARRGRVTASTVRAGTAVITATVPLAELFGYASRLRGRTQGRGTFTTRPRASPRPPADPPLRPPSTRGGGRGEQPGEGVGEGVGGVDPALIPDRSHVVRGFVRLLQQPGESPEAAAGDGGETQKNTGVVMTNVNELFELDIIEIAAPVEDDQAEAQAATGSWPYYCKTTI